MCHIHVYSYVANLVTRTQYYYVHSELNLVAKTQWILQCIAEKDLGTCLIVLVLYALALVLCVKLCTLSVGVCKLNIFIA